MNRRARTMTDKEYDRAHFEYALGSIIGVALIALAFVLIKAHAWAVERSEPHYCYGEVVYHTDEGVPTFLCEYRE